MPSTDVAPTDKITLLKLLAKGQPLPVVAAAVALTVDQVRDIASHHGYPDAHRMEWAIDVLSKKLDEANALPPAEHTTEQDIASARGQHVRPPSIRINGMGSAPSGTTSAVAPPGPPPKAAPVHVPNPTAELLDRAAQSDSKRIQALGVKIADLLGDLRTRLEEEEEQRRKREQQARKRAEEKELRQAERQAAIDEVQAAEQALKDARAKLRRHKNDGSNGRASVHVVPETGEYRESRSKGGQATNRTVDYDAREVRAWCKENGVGCPSRGRFLPRHVVDQYKAAQAVD